MKERERGGRRWVWVRHGRMRGSLYVGLWKRLSVSDRLPLQLSDQPLSAPLIRHITTEHLTFFHPLLLLLLLSLCPCRDIKMASVVPAGRNTELVCQYLSCIFVLTENIRSDPVPSIWHLIWWMWLLHCKDWLWITVRADQT